MIRNIAKDHLVRLFKLTIIKTLLSFAEIKKEYELQKFSRQGKSGCLSVIIFLVPLNELNEVLYWGLDMGKYELRNTIIDLLLRIDEDSGYSHLLIDHEMKARNINPKDEGLLTEIVYGTIQRKLTLDYYLRSFIRP